MSDTSPTHPLNKDSLRQRILTARSQFDAHTIHHRSGVIQRALLQSSAFENADKIAAYSPIRNEVETQAIAEGAWKMGQQIFFPRWNPETRSISLAQAEADTPLIKMPWGTMEPEVEADELFPANEMDLIIVPGVVFDEQGFRIGYGYGGYDRFLKHFEGARVGLAFEMQVVDSLPRDTHDIACTQVISETRIIEA